MILRGQQLNKTIQFKNKEISKRIFGKAFHKYGQKDPAILPPNDSKLLIPIQLYSSVADAIIL